MKAGRGLKPGGCCLTYVVISGFRPGGPEASPHHVYVATTPDALTVAESIARDWEGVGISGHLLARNVDTGEELGFDVDTAVPLASVIKVPLALVVLEAISHGVLDPAAPLVVDPRRSVGSTGVSAFRFPRRSRLPTSCCSPCQ